MDADETSFESSNKFSLYIFFLVMSISIGVACVLMASFISMKIKRLVGRSIFSFGEDEVNSKLVFEYSVEFKTRWTRWKKEFEGKELQLCARQWYYKEIPLFRSSPAHLVSYVTPLFVLFILFFSASILIKISESASLLVFGIISVFYFFIVTIVIIVLSAAECFHQLL